MTRKVLGVLVLVVLLVSSTSAAPAPLPRRIEDKELIGVWHYWYYGPGKIRLHPGGMCQGIDAFGCLFRGTWQLTDGRLDIDYKRVNSHPVLRHSWQIELIKLHDRKIISRDPNHGFKRIK